jgi:hypothetical protein
MADVNARIQLELVDGPAQKALAEFIKTSGAADKSVAGLNKSIGGLSKNADSSSVSFQGFAKIVSEDLGGKGAASVGQLSALLGGPLLIALGAVAVAGLAVSKVLDLTIINERNLQVKNSFDAIAASAGLAGEELRSGLLAASNGLADDTDILKAANKSIIELGSNASKLPEIMEVARKTTALFGGELVQNFENLSSALASGNTKALRNIGLVIDAETAQRKYAESIGVTVAQLSDAGKKQAIQNAALEQAKLKFKDVDESSTRATQGLQRLKVSGGEFVDAFAAAIQQSKFFAATFDVLASAINKTSEAITRNFGSGVDQLQVKLSDSRGEVERYTARLAGLEDRLKRSVGTEKEGVVAAIALVNQNLAIAKAQVDDTIKAIGRLAKAPVEKGQAQQEKQVNTEAILKDRTEAAKRASDAELAVAQASADLEVEILRNKLANQQITQAEFDKANFDIEQQNYAAKQEIEAQRFADENSRLEAARAANLLTETGYQQQRDALAAQYSAKVIKFDADELKSKTKLAQEEEKLQRAKVAAVGDTFANLSVLMQTSSRELFAIGKAAAIASSTINTYEAITKTMASVPYPFNIPLAVAQGIAGFVQVANISSTNPSFASGGIVPGTSYSGDNVTANVNSGEMVLNRSQQSNLFNQIRSGGGSDVSAKLDSLIGLLASRDEAVIVNIGGKTVVDTLRSELASGRRFD